VGAPLTGGPLAENAPAELKPFQAPHPAPYFYLRTGVGCRRERGRRQPLASLGRRG